MSKKIKLFLMQFSQVGQNMIEYMLVFAGVVVVLIIVLGPNGLLTQKIDQSLNRAVQGTKCMALKECYDPGGCPPTPNNGCCEPGEVPAPGNSDC